MTICVWLDGTRGIHRKRRLIFSVSLKAQSGKLRQAGVTFRVSTCFFLLCELYGVSPEEMFRGRIEPKLSVEKK